jgi:hypothetical protein
MTEKDFAGFARLFHFYFGGIFFFGKKMSFLRQFVPALGQAQWDNPNLVAGFRISRNISNENHCLLELVPFY